MNDWRRRLALPGLVLILGLAWGCGDGGHELTPLDPGDVASLTPPQFTHVTPVFTPGNPSCTGLGYFVGFKPFPEPPPSGTYTFPGTSETVTITSNGIHFDWTSTLGIDAVIVKGGPNANVYAYDPPAEEFSDTGLHSPINPNNNQPYAISHIEFCYDYELTAEKTAAGTYDERHTWDVEKSVDPESQMGFAGDLLSWTWTVDVSESSVDENFSVTGNITINNPTPFQVTFSVGDQLNDGTVAAVNCPSLTLAAGASVVCSYTASPADASATLNTATITSQTANVGGASATAAVAFAANVIDGTATIDDDQEPDFPEDLTAGQGPWQWTEMQSHTCSSDKADYGADGTYSATLDNTAVVTGSDGQTDEASASTTYTCKAGFMELLKLTEGQVDPTKDWSFTLYEGPDGFGGTSIGSSTTFGDADGVLVFGDPALRPDLTYTVCELGVPAGWSTLWKVDTNNNGTADLIVIPYNPNADDVPPANLGNLCFDFGASSAYPVVVGQTLVFEVDNTFPGGDPRTPGYWKNWNTCTGGNQAATAAKNGGPAEGWYILDDILNNPGVTWGSFTIATCADGVSILDQRDLDSGRKRASDAAYTLAMHLLAAQLNFAAGAETCQAAQDAAVAGENLLVSIGFNGTGSYLRPKDAAYHTALDLATTLDDYNNGNLCQ